MEEQNLKGLSEVLAAVDQEELLAELKKEASDPEYKKQSDFASCMERAEALSEKARVRCNRIYAYAILKHRETEHEEDRTEEKTILESQMSTEDIELASTRGWWLPNS